MNFKVNTALGKVIKTYLGPKLNNYIEFSNQINSITLTLHDFLDA